MEFSGEEERQRRRVRCNDWLGDMPWLLTDRRLSRASWRGRWRGKTEGWCDEVPGFIGGKKKDRADAVTRCGSVDVNVVLRWPTKR